MKRPKLPPAVVAIVALALLAAGLSDCTDGAVRRFDAPPDPYHYHQPFEAGAG